MAENRSTSRKHPSQKRSCPIRQGIKCNKEAWITAGQRLLPYEDSGIEGAPAKIKGHTQLTCILKKVVSRSDRLAAQMHLAGCEGHSRCLRKSLRHGLEPPFVV